MKRAGRGQAVVPALASAALLLLVALGVRMVALAPPDFEGQCAAGEPHAITACYLGLSTQQMERPFDAAAPSVVLFTDTPNDDPHSLLARYDETGAVWGLAYRSAEPAVYAAAFHKQQLPFGPGGPGAIYRIDLATGIVAPFLEVPNAGPDRHRLLLQGDFAAQEWVGRTSLGDLDLSEDESELFVVNLDDRRIYRFAMPSGDARGSFAQGGEGESWAADARPFALAYRDGFLFHGVVASAETSGRRSDLAAAVFRSRPDGSEMRKVADFSLDFSRGRLNATWFDNAMLDWRPWDDLRTELPGQRFPYIVAPMPLLTDIAFGRDGAMALGFRDRNGDAQPHFLEQTGGTTGGSRRRVGVGVGDILQGPFDGTEWRFEPDTEHLDDRVPWFGDETGLGGLASLTDMDLVLAGAYAVKPGAGAWTSSAGAYWYENATGNKVARESVCDPIGLRVYHPEELSVRAAWAHDGEVPSPQRGPATVGDVEALCAADVPPSPTPTSTEPPTATASASPTPVVSPTRTPRPSATPTSPPPPPIYLPVLLREPPCVPGVQHTDVALVLDASTSMLEPTAAGRSKLEAALTAVRLFLDNLDLAGGDQAAIVAFNADVRLVQGLTADRGALDAALASIQVAQQTRIQLGVIAGHEELMGPRHTTTNNRALVVLTDGRNNPEPVSEAVMAARAAKADGLRLFTIGLGDEVERAALAQMASQEGDFFFAPDGEDLLDIYGRIATAIPCPPGTFWPARP